MKRFILYIGISLVILSLSAQEKLSLTEAIKVGLENNYALQIQRNVQKVSEINNTWGNTTAMPTISVLVSGRENFNYNDQEDYREETIVPDLSLNWILFNGFSARINKERFVELESQSKGNTVILVENTIQDIILAYNNCLLQKEMVTVYKELSDLSKDRYDRSMSSKELGAGTSYETLQAKTSWLEDQSNYLRQKVNYENAVRTLNFVMAVSDNKEWDFTSGLEIDAPEYALEKLSQKMKSSNSTLKNQYIYQSLKAKETELAKRAYYPTLSLSSGISNSDYSKYFSNTTPDITNNSSNVYAGLSLSWNIFNGGTRKRSVQIAQITEESAAVQTAQIEHSLSNQLLQMYSAYQVQKAVLELTNEQEATARLNLDISADKLNNGSINSFNYRDIQILYMNSAIAKFKAIFDIIQSKTELLRITGGIVDEFE